MADSKKYNGSTWEHSLRKLATATDTFTTLPADIYADGNNATVGISGNMEQNGTPTPDNPIQPSECGERTANLANENDLGLQKWISSSGTISDNAKGTIFKEKIAITATNYTVKATANQSAVAGIGVAIYNSNDEFIRREYSASSDKTLTFATTTGDNYFKIIVSTRDTSTESLIQSVSIMANEGSTTKPYEPYGIKIPISSASTTTPVYLGEVESTRRIKKLALTGEETWEIVNPSPTSRYFRMSIGNMYSVIADMVISSHYTQTPINSSNTNNGLNVVNSSSVNKAILLIRPYNVEDIDLLGWQNYLRQQYANETPVCVWYALATPTTGIVNEPIRKIGDYADTVSGITIPVTAGGDTLSVDTTVQPSEVTATYKGWHNASVKEKSANYLDENDFGLVEVAAGVYRTGTDAGVLPSGTYTLSVNKSSSAVQIYRTTKNGSTYNYETISELPYTFTADGVSNQIFRTAGSTETSWADAGYSKVMLNAGETAQTYESYWK